MLNKGNYNLIRNEYEASDTILLIKHRLFTYDKELIELASSIAELAVLFENDCGNKRTKLELEYKRDLFRIKCDIYTTADWNRIKS